MPCELEIDPGQSNTGKGGYVAVDGELVARADEAEGKGGGGLLAGGGRGGDSSSSAGAGIGGGAAAAAAAAGDCDWQMPYGPMGLKVVRSASRVFCAACGRGSGGVGNAV